MKLSYPLVVIGVSAVLVGCGQPEATTETSSPRTNPPTASAEQLKQDLQQTARDTTAVAVQDKDRFLASAQQGLTNLDSRIAALTEKAKSLAGDAKAQADQSLATLEQKRVQLNGQLDKLKAATNDTWQKVKAAYDAAAADVKKAYQDAKAKIQ